MYDAILVSPHYHYNPDGRPMPSGDDAHYQDLSMIIPLGIIHVAQYLHDSGFKVRVVHLPHEFYTLQHLGLALDQMANPVEMILKQYPARVCGLQAHFYLYAAGALQIAGIYRELFPESIILAGGHMATACWQELLTVATHVDGVILGEGELSFRQVVGKSRANGKYALKAIAGVAGRGPDDDFFYNPPQAGALLDLAAMPTIDPAAPPFENLIWPQRSFMNISRGICPEPCAYCVANCQAINPRPFRTMQIDRILAQLALYQEKGIRSIFMGENHFLDMPFMTALIEQIIHADFDLYFELETHPAVFNHENLLSRMIAAGFLRYTMGCESGSNRLLKHIGRRANARQNIESVKKVAEAGGLVVTSWICNLPGETETDFQATLAMLDRVVEAGGFIYWIENLHVLPGSPLHRNPGKWDIDLLLKDLKDWFHWAPKSKTYVDLEVAARAPRDYLTHLNRNSTPHEMMTRFYGLRRHAKSQVPAMLGHLEKRAAHLPAELVQIERQKLEWYAHRGWRLWLF